MNPYKLREIYKYLTRAKKAQPDLPDVFPASKAPIPPKTQNVEEIEAINRFIRSERQQKAGGGMLVQPSADGSRPGYAGVKGMKNPSKQSYTPAQQKAMKEAFPDIKFDFKEYPKLGIPREINGKRNVDYNKVIAFTKDRPEAPAFKSFKKDLLNQKERNLVMSNFELPEGIEKWDFDKHKFGFVAGGKKGQTGVKGYYKLKKTKKDIIDPEVLRERTNLIGNIQTFLKGPTPFRVVAAIGRPKGWIMNSMLRVYDNEIKSKVKNLTYEPVYGKINNKKIIIGFKDNTKAGGGKTYYGLNKYTKANGTPWEKHGDFAKVKKFIDISKKSFNEPNEVITGLLKKGGITQTVRLNDLLNYLADRTPKQALQTAIEKHHTQGVGAKGSIGNATADLQLLDVVSNRKTREIENRIRSNTMLPGDNQALKNLGAIVQHKGKIYGSGPKTPEGGFKRIEKNVQTSLEKFNKKDFKQLKTFLQKIGCPGLASGGRAGFDVGTNCQMKGANLINSGMKNASPAQLKNFAAFANRTASLGRNVMKFGVIPEALYIAADSAIRMGMGDNFNEAFLRASEYIRPGDQTKLAEMLEADRFFGPEVAGIIGKSIDYKNELAKVQSLEDQKTNLENLSGGGAFDYVGDTSQDVKNIDIQLKQATDNLNNKFKMTDAEQIYADRMQKETDDARSSGSFFTKLKSKFRDVGQDQSDIETLGMPEKTQEDLNKKILPAFGDSKDFITMSTADAINLAKAYRAQGSNVSAKDIIAYRDSLRNSSLSDLAQQFNPESVYGASGTMGEPINKPVFKKPQNVIPEMEKEIIGQTNVANPFDLDLSMIGSGLRGFAAAGGGIAKMVGDSSGPPPVRGPNPQGLLSLKNRVRNY